MPRPPAPPPLPPGALRGLYAWLDTLPLGRRKRHLARDFSDGVMLAEVVKLFRPRLVDLHNYVPTCNTSQKLSNWSVLNRQGSKQGFSPAPSLAGPTPRSPRLACMGGPHPGTGSQTVSLPWASLILCSIPLEAPGGSPPRGPQ